jgi:hypothetical protein
MNPHLKHVLLIRLSDHLQDTQQFCADLDKPVQDLILCDSVPIDLQDKATQKFLEILNYDPVHRKANVASFRYHVGDALSRMEQDPTMEKSLALQEYLAGVDAGAYWDQMNRLFRHMTGSSFCEIVDASNVLMHPLEQGLNGDQWLSASLQVARLDTGKTFLIEHTVAIASTLENLLLLLRDEVLQGDETYDFFRKKRSPDLVVGEEDLMALEPILVTIKKNNQYWMQFPIKFIDADGRHDIEWERGRFRANREIIKAVTSVAPPEVANRIKTKYLESELGL